VSPSILSETIVGFMAEFAAFMTLDISRYTRLAQDMGLGED
jgi:hypothetical protein